MHQEQDSLITRFIDCDSTEEALKLADSCNTINAFVALIELNGSYIKVSNSARSMIGCSANKLETETIFTMAADGDRSELFKACSAAAEGGEVYRVLQRMKCDPWREVPMVTHMRKVKGTTGRDAILCMNVKA